MGYNIGIIDDLIKNEYEANNNDVREKHWKFYTDTFLSRLEQDAIQIVVATRWHKEDLCGRLLENEPGEWYVHSRQAIERGEMLCPSMLSHEGYLGKKKLMGDEVFSANFHQIPIDAKGKLYQELRTYTDLPDGVVRNYTDTADQGSDNLCSINYVVYNNEAFVVDVLYTRDGMEVTEPATAKMLAHDKVTQADIESNNGGRGFARAVERLSRDSGNTFTQFHWFHQSRNKQARIISASAWVQQHIYFPHNWRDRWPQFYKDVTTYQKSGRNKHDDAPDVLSGICEYVTGKAGRSLVDW
jgi:predicted phage terminase large subunit-like protein